MSGIGKENKITKLVEQMLKYLGEDMNNPDIKETPRRFAKAMIDMSTATKIKPKITTFPSNSNAMVVVKGIEVRSLCLHHLFPFWGEATVSYIPNGKIVGLSKFQRAMDYIAEKPQDQENLTQEYLNFLVGEINPKFMMVKIKARHSCIAVRGAKAHNSETITLLTYGESDKPVNLNLD